MTIQDIQAAILPQRRQLLEHPLYSRIGTPEDLNVFLENHVYAVWDFMSLLKALQQKLTCTTTPWYATKDAQMRYLINEIVLAEESDLTQSGERKSHFEMYLSAMKACGADTSAIDGFIEDLFSLHNIFVVIRKSELHANVKEFLEFTFRTIEIGKPHCIAAAFTFGREDLIPAMFTEILSNFQKQFPEKNLDELVYYFERHIELDADEHGPMAMQMIESLCGTDENKWQEALLVSKEALEMRLKMWDAIEEQLEKAGELV